MSLQGAPGEPNDVPYGDDLCPLCGAEMDWEDCWDCHGHGGWWPAREDDSLAYTPDDWERCQTCRGDGGYWVCPAAAWHEPGRDE